MRLGWFGRSDDDQSVPHKPAENVDEWVSSLSGEIPTWEEVKAYMPPPKNPERTERECDG